MVKLANEMAAKIIQPYADVLVTFMIHKFA